MKIIRPTIKTAALYMGCVFLFNSASFAADARFPREPYRAEAVVISGGVSTPMVMYASGRKMRIELNTGATTAVQIIDFDANQAFMLTNTNGQKVAVKIRTEKIVEQIGLNDGDLGEAKGNKKIAQITCKIHTMKDATVCVSKDDITLESIAPNGTMRVTKLAIGTQNARLFEMPEGYTVVDMTAMAGMNPESFGSNDNTLNGLLGAVGLENSSGSFLDGINDIVDAEDGDASGQAAVDALMGQMGLDAGTLTTGDTTAGVLVGEIDSALDLSDEDKAKAAVLMKENERRMKIIENEGMSGLFRDAGMSDAEIANMEKSQAEFRQKLQEHADKHKGQVNSIDTSSVPSDARMFSLEADMDALNKRAEGLAADGNISEADKTQIEQEALLILEGILGELPKD